MIAFVVDDEVLACRQLKTMLKATGCFEMIQTYTDPEQALDEAANRHPDVAFLDIEMPEMSGIELAARLQDNNTNIKVVFTTAFDEFAIKAFELNAVDYLLKPIMKDRLKRTIERLLHERYIKQEQAERETISFAIACFDHLKFYRMDKGKKVDVAVKWRTSKARELYAFLLSSHDRFVSKEALVDLLWPEADPNKAATHLYTTIYQVRKVLDKLAFKQKIVKNDIGYSLTLAGASIDVEEWEARLERLHKLDRSTYQDHIQAFNDYKGHYFEEYGYLWAEPERIRLCQLWLQHAHRLVDFLIKNNEDTEALAVCQKVDRIQPGDERNMKQEMTIYNKTGNVEGAIRIYERLKEVNETEV
ncbi:response regulator [Sporolactobacillus terrae]|uniref:DNA-binding response regulator n=1 Tax=Sporolactobacillus terrae TaxID=269673 RepID=A0ABX5QAS0_9BACL|nr:response regulator [Sporolactobacillus terrae]QAA23755.1 DNA-binding response regulator [Sporolactobacillus terrae]QAA26726.1 DNA-binding response regulator [Sporolactobacillus terrae]